MDDKMKQEEVEKFLTMLSVTGFQSGYDEKSNNFYIVYDEKSRAYLEKVLLDLSDLNGYQFRLSVTNHQGKFSFALHNQELEFKSFLQSLRGSLASYDDKVQYADRMDEELKQMYLLFEQALSFDGNFGIGVQNFEDMRKFVIKTDMKEIEDALTEAGLVVKDGKIVLRSLKDTNFLDVLKRTNQNVLDGKKKDNHQRDALPEEVTTEVYEKEVRGKDGKDYIAQMSVVNQDGADTDYERKVQVNYINKEDGTRKSTEIYGYKDGHEFDNNAAPEIIDGFHKKEELGGRETGSVTNPNFNTNMPIDSVHSIVASDKENNLVGDEYREVDIAALEDTGVISALSYEDENAKKYENKPKQMIKTLGENNSGLTNYLGLFLFFVVDIAAITVGICLLFHK